MPESLPDDIKELQTRAAGLCNAIQDLLANRTVKELPTERVVQLSKHAGIFRLNQPKEYGGLEASLLEQMVVHDTLGSHNLCHVNGLFGPGAGVLTSLQDPARSTYLKPMLAGEKRSAFGFTEPDNAQRATWGVLSDDFVIVNGQKSYVTGGATADFINVLVQVENHGPAMIVIDRDLAGVKIKETFGSIDGSHHASMVFTDVKVPITNVIGEIGRGIPRAMDQIGNTRMIFAAQSVGLCRWVIDLVTAHIQAPHRSGEALAKKEGVRLRYADMRIKTYAARSMVYRTARLGDSGENIVNEGIASKVFATEAIGEVVDSAIQLVGGRALQHGHPLEELYRRVRAWRLAEGASDVLRLNLVRGHLELNKGRL